MRRLAFVFAAFVVAGALASSAAAQVHEVVPGIWLLRGTFTPGHQPDGNTIVFDGTDGLIVVDTGRHVAHTQAILDFAKQRNRPIAAVVNSHWHLDHIGGNAMIRDAYPNVHVYASNALNGALTGFLANYKKQLQGVIPETQDADQRTAYESEVHLIDLGTKLAPDVVITSSGPRTIAGRTLRVGLETNSVTAGDVWLFDESRSVLVSGDLITLPAPFLDTACPSRWGESLDRLAALDFDLVIPGHGAPMTRKQFTAYQSAYHALVSCAASTNEKQRCIDDWTAAIRPLSDADEKFTRSLMGYYVDVLRSDAAKARCAG
ncbi:MAG: MBL fold metallo-hydrolase [Acidobacteria bacterium]|nr:MBL fold metallo-hydrolase [Acidobacteriota bacterium]MBV9477117.1 MBL fold metallo-hydrolase [Acidobacteriota bacterium]